MKIQEVIKMYMEQKGIKPSILYTKLDIDMQRVYRIMRGDSKLTADEFKSICELLEVKPEYIFKIADEKGDC